jgi:hypothetical protein
MQYTAALRILFESDERWIRTVAQVYRGSFTWQRAPRDREFALRRGFLVSEGLDMVGSAGHDPLHVQVAEAVAKSLAEAGQEESVEARMDEQIQARMEQLAEVPPGTLEDEPAPVASWL